MKFQLKHKIISLPLSICLMMTLISGDCLNSSYNNITACYTGVQSRSSTLRPIVERVFSRKKRFLLLPPGGSLKFTANIGKRLLTPYPRGFAFVFEVATYHEGFATPAELIPKWLRGPTTTTPKPKGPTTPIYVYIPGIGLRLKARPAIKPAKVQRIDDVDALQWVENRKRINYVDPRNWQKYAKYHSNDYHRGEYEAQKWWRPPMLEEPKHFYSNAQGYDAPSQTWLPPIVSNAIYQQPNEFHYNENYKPPSWQHYHGHRDRRELFEKFEGFSKILGIDMKACILRAMCECKSMLLPPGYSMLQDMMRVILTMPNQPNTNDEYAHAHGVKAENCEEKFHQKCPVSLLNWILNPMKPIKQK